MKKTLIILFLLFTMFTYAQDTFVNKYTSFVVFSNNKYEEEKTCSVTFVFNEQDTNNIVCYFSDGTKKTFIRIGGIEKGKTNNGTPYQSVTCVDDSNGKKVDIQVFDDNLRIHYSDGFIEFMK